MKNIIKYKVTSGNQPLERSSPFSVQSVAVQSDWRFPPAVRTVSWQPLPAQIWPWPWPQWERFWRRAAPLCQWWFGLFPPASSLAWSALPFPLCLSVCHHLPQHRLTPKHRDSRLHDQKLNRWENKKIKYLILRPIYVNDRQGRVMQGYFSIDLHIYLINPMIQHCFKISLL